MELLRKTALLKLQQQTDGRDPLSVTELCFGDVPLVPVERFQPFVNLTRLTLVSMKPMLKSVLDVPLHLLPNLKALDVSDNKIADLGTSAASSFPAPLVSMRRLSLTNNLIGTVGTMSALGQLFPQLEVLELMFNPICAQGDNYRSQCLEILPATMQVIDGISRDGKEVEVADSDESGSSEDDADEEEEEEESDSGEEEGDDEEAESDNADEIEPLSKKQRTEESH